MSILRRGTAQWALNAERDTPDEAGEMLPVQATQAWFYLFIYFFAGLVLELGRSPIEDACYPRFGQCCD